MNEKFIQICVLDGGQLPERLFALDSQGGIWEFCNHDQNWRLLPDTKRADAEQPAGTEGGM